MRSFIFFFLTKAAAAAAERIQNGDGRWFATATSTALLCSDNDWTQL